MEPYQRRIARAFFGGARVIAALLPRGNFKTSLAAMLGIHELLTGENPSITIGAASLNQARVCFERMVGYIQGSDLDQLVEAGRIEIRHLELRLKDGDRVVGRLRVRPSDGPKAHGLSESLYIADELWAWKPTSDLLDAMKTGLIKRRDARLFVISTAAQRADSPLGLMRTQALAGSNVKRRGVVLESKGSELHWLEWSVPDDRALNMKELKRANPYSGISVDDLRSQRELVQGHAFAQFHANRWGVGASSWLPPGAWAACEADFEIEDGADVFVGVDVGGTRSRTVCVWVAEDLRVGVRVWSGDEAVLDVAAFVRELAARQTIRECAFDPWRFRSEALRLEADGLTMVEFPQTATRMAPASEKLYAAIIEKRLRHPNDAELNQHIANCIARETPRGWRLDKATDAEPNDAAIALAMAVDRATAPQPVAPQVLGYL